MRIRGIALLLLVSIMTGCSTSEHSNPQSGNWTAAPPPVNTTAQVVPPSPIQSPSPTRFLPTGIIPATNTPLTIFSTPTPQAISSPENLQPTAQSNRTPTPQIQPTLSMDAWKQLPVLPDLSANVVRIYQKGIALGNNPRSFAKVGDCESTPTWFLGSFDLDTRSYDLGEYGYLAEVIEYYKGSFGRDSVAARRGANATSILTPLWADPKQCLPGEMPLSCEYRVMRPSIALITLGTNDVWQKEKFEPQMRKIIEITLQAGIVPVLATKADNLEEDHAINASIASLAREYDIPLWNFWLAVQTLPARGLQGDGSHLTWAPNFFDRYNLMNAWPVRNLTALQVLDLLRNEFKSR